MLGVLSLWAFFDLVVEFEILMAVVWGFRDLDGLNLGIGRDLES